MGWCDVGRFLDVMCLDVCEGLGVMGVFVGVQWIVLPRYVCATM